MAVANTKSTFITNADATPQVQTQNYLARGTVMECVGTVETLAADDALSLYRLCRVPSNARVTSVKVATDAIAGATASTVGVWQTAANGGAVVDADEWATLDISSASAFTEVLNEAAATEIADCQKQLWEKLGLSSDPGRDYDFCVQVNDVTGAGTISMKVQYVI